MTNGLKALATVEEIKEINVLYRGKVKLRRTFNMALGDQTLKFWRVIGPVGHPNLESDLSLDGLKDWGII